MATDLYFNKASVSTGIYQGSPLNNRAGSSVNWTTEPLTTARGAGVTSVALATSTVTGPTNGIEFGGGAYFAWISMPLAAAITISGTITLNLWGYETNMSANCAINAVIERLDPTGAVASTIATTARTTELAIGTVMADAAVNNFTVTPTSTAMEMGDRIRVRVFVDDAGTMGSGFNCAFTYAGTSAAANGDSYVRFNENLTFLTTAPSGTTLYLTGSTGPAVGAADERLLSTSRGSGGGIATVNTANSPITPVQWTLTAGGTAIEWYSFPLEVNRLHGLVGTNLWLSESNASANVGHRVELAICNQDGSSPVVWAAQNIAATDAPAGTLTQVASGELPTTAAAHKGWISGAPTLITQGQRIRFRVYLDDAVTGSASGFTAILNYAATTGGTTGDSYLTFPITLTEYVPEPTITFSNAYRYYADGTESGSVPTDPQSVDATVDPASDANLLLRIAVPTFTGALPSTEFWLEYSKTGISWSPVNGGDGVNDLLASYSDTNVDSWEALLTGNAIGMAQSFTGDGKKLSRVSFVLRNAGYSNSYLYAKLYTNNAGVPGTLLETSGIQYGQLISIGSATVVTFIFSARTTVDNGTTYWAAIETANPGDAGNHTQVGYDASSPSGAGSSAIKTLAGGWTDSGGIDLGYEVYTQDALNVVTSFNSSNLTDGGATTNRLTGTGSFEAGKISESGAATGITVATNNNFTELLFPITVKSAGVVSGDGLRFRLTRRGSTTGLTYGDNPHILIQSPTVTSDTLYPLLRGLGVGARSTGAHRGTNSANLAGSTTGWTTDPLMPQRMTNHGVATATATSVAGPTSGIETNGVVASTKGEWVSPPLSADVTISGTVTFNLWGRENADANAAINAIVERLGPDGSVLSTIVQSARTTELSINATTNAVNNFTATATSTACVKGDRLRLRVYFDDAGSNMITGQTLNFSYGSPTASVNGDSYVQFSQSLSFDFSEPAGTVFYPTNTALGSVGSNDSRTMQTTRGGGVVTKTTNTTAGFTAPIAVSNGSGGTHEWFTPAVNAFTLSGKVRVNLRAWQSASNTRASIRAEIAVVNADGTGATVWGADSLISNNSPWGWVDGGTDSSGELQTAEAHVIGWISGPDTSVAQGKRIRLRVLVDDINSTALVTGRTVSFALNGTAQDASGDSWIQFQQTVTESSGNVITPGGSITAAGSLTRQVNKSWGGSTTSTGALRRGIEKLFSGSSTGAGALTKLRQVTKSLSGSITPSSGGAGASYSDDFTRADSLNVANAGVGLGSAWTGDGWRIQSNAAQRPGGNAYTIYDTQVLTADQWAEIDIPTGDPTGDTASVILRSSNNTPAAMDDFYEFLIGNSGTKAWIIKYTNGAFVGFVADVTISADASAGTLRGEAEGTTLRLKWNGVTKASVTDSTHNAGRYTGMGSVDSSNSALAFRSGDLGAVGRGVTFQVNKAFTGSSTPAGALARVSNRVRTYTGSITPSGALLKSLARTFSGSITPSGALARLKTVLRSFSGSITPSGSLNRTVGKAFAGTITATGTLLKVASLFRSYGGTTTATGTLTRSVGKGLAGSITPSGSLSKMLARLFGGSITPAGTLLRSIARTFSGSITTTGTILRMVAKALGGSITPSGSVTTEFSGGAPEEINVGGSITATGALARQVGKGLSGSTAPAGALLRSVAKLFNGSITPTGALLRSISKVFAGSITPTGALSRAKTVARTFTGSLTATGSMLRMVGKGLTGSVTPSGAIARYISKSFGGVSQPTGFVNMDTGLSIFVGGTIMAAGTVSKAISKVWGGTIQPTGTLYKLFPRSFGGVITATGNMTAAKLTAILLSGSITAVGALARTISKVFGGSTTPSGTVTKIGSLSIYVGGAITAVGTLAKGISKFFSGSTTPSGSLIANVVDALTSIGSFIVNYTERVKSVIFSERRHTISDTERRKQVHNFGNEDQ